ncbi:hypothetical protein D9Q98_006471 [Chlorella vulgaris]|uniref:Pentacotripeptide-repeat region of PRORP domain-containing protein n=1 Tax=Chlorella vulgaris TaxID=3077 RepID=A0A9D4TKB2_CHLVU|nr:hypothetical protein D9Q98_006471 [Chlorella vulgaris]
MPGQAACLLRASHACFGGRKPARLAHSRLRPAVAAKDRPAAATGGTPEDQDGLLMQVDASADVANGPVRGAEGQAAAAHPRQAPAGASPPSNASAAAATAGAAAHAQQGSNGASSNGSAASRATSPAAAPPPWQLDADAAASSSNGAVSSSSNGGGNGWYPPNSSISSTMRSSTNGVTSMGRGGGRGSGRSGGRGSGGRGGWGRKPAQQQQRRDQTFYGGADSSLAGAAAALEQARSMDYKEVPASEVVAVYEALCDGRDLDEALTVIKGCIRASRTDVLAMLKHYRFLRPAASRNAVKQALRFVQLLPRQYVDARTYNMLLRVCAQAGDLRNAMHVSDMLQAAGLKLDGILYTTLISACASAGDAEKAFLLYGQMKADGVAIDKMVYSSVVHACAAEIQRLPQSERRQQLVLLERAFQLVEDMKGAKIPTDAAVWNALVTAAGRAAQLQRAFNVLEDMLHNGTRPNDRTYASLIDACARAGDKELALRVYRKARREGCAHTLMVYAAAVHACIQAHGGCDSAAVMVIYSDMQREGVEPDNQLFGMLMKAAGAAGDLDLVRGLRDEMQREGLTPCTGTESALMAVHIKLGQLPEAHLVYRSLRASGQWPHPYAMNALLNAYANSFRLGDVVSLLSDMAAGEQRPDAFTFSAIFNACQRADEAELALEVARLMKLRGVRMDETHALMLLRICYNRLRQAWVPGGYPPNRPTGGAGGGGFPGARQSPLRQRLLEALTPRGREVELREQPDDVAWESQAFSIYREAVAAGVKPSMRMLNRMLMCLRVAWEGNQEVPEGGLGTAGSPESLLPHNLQPQQLSRAPARGDRIGLEGVYHMQAISILEESIISNVVPSFQTDSTEPIDLRDMPPAVAEVYVLTVLSTMQRQSGARRVISQNLVFLVPPYEGTKVFMPSHLTHINYDQTEAGPGGQPPLTHSSYDSDDEANGVSFSDADDAFARASSDASEAATAAPGGGDERTGLGVAGVLRRLRIWAREYGDRGFILLESKEITRWCKAMARAVDRRSASALAVQKPYGQQPYGQPLQQQGRMGLQQQQRQIRMDF